MNKQYDIFFDEENKVYQIRTKGDVIVIEFSDNEKEIIFNETLKLYDKNDFYTFKQLVNKLTPKYPHEKVLDVIKELLDCSLLNADNFEPEENGSPTQSSIPAWMNQKYNDLSEMKLCFIGEKEFGERIKEKAELYKYKSIELIEMTEKLDEKNINKIFTIFDFIIVDLTNWNPYYIDKINEIALSNNKPWLLVDGAIDAVNFSIGPIFHGKETGCYECYSTRIKSNDEFITYTQAYEKHLRNGKKTAKPNIVSLLVKDLASTIILMDISKYIGGWYVPETWRASLVLNSMNFTISKHDFLKAPICYKCKPELDYSPSPWLESVTLKS